jgi:hypothetical protein
MPFRQQRMSIAASARRRHVSEGDIDRPVTRVVETLLRFDGVLSRPAPAASIAASPEHRALAYEAAAKSIVLLKNGAAGVPLLPLDASRLKRIAVLGRLASIPNLGDRGSSNVIPPSVVTPLDGLRAALLTAEVPWPTARIRGEERVRASRCRHRRRGAARSRTKASTSPRSLNSSRPRAAPRPERRLARATAAGTPDTQRGSACWRPAATGHRRPLTTGLGVDPQRRGNPATVVVMMADAIRRRTARSGAGDPDAVYLAEGGRFISPTSSGRVN